MERNRHLDWILASAQSYRAGRLDLDGLTANIGAEASALEGDVGEPVRLAVMQLARQLGVITEEADFLGVASAARVAQALDDAEATIACYHVNQP